jgi:hypothetical protein
VRPVEQNNVKNGHTTANVWDSPLVEKVAEGVDDIGLAELVLNEGHDVWQVGFSYILAVYDFRHDKRLLWRSWKRKQLHAYKP